MSFRFQQGVVHHSSFDLLRLPTLSMRQRACFLQATMEPNPEKEIPPGVCGSVNWSGHWKDPQSLDPQNVSQVKFTTGTGRLHNGLASTCLCQKLRIGGCPSPVFHPKKACPVGVHLKPPASHPKKRGFLEVVSDCFFQSLLVFGVKWMEKSRNWRSRFSLQKGEPGVSQFVEFNSGSEDGGRFSSGN